MKNKHKPRAPFLLKPYSRFDGWAWLLIMSLFIFGTCKDFIKSHKPDDFAGLVLALLMFLFFYGMFRLKYRSLLMEEGRLTVVNWLWPNKTYALSNINGYLLKEVWTNSFQITTCIVLVANNSERIIIDREYFFNEKLDRLIAGFERYQIPYLGLEEIKLKGSKRTYQAIGFWIYIIAGIAFATLRFMRHEAILNH